jgi:chemotaxis protein methyltransferase CheR
MTHGAGEALIQALGDKIAVHTGMRFERDRLPELVRAVDVLGLCRPELEAWLSRSWTQADVQALAVHLSVGETYFFREPAAFEVLEHELLPPLIDQRRTTTRHLRVWSAGCSTGEETYSLAIMISRLIPDHADWDITLLGTDIHPGFLARAEEGVYGDWSFRGVPQHVRESDFDDAGERRFAVKPVHRRFTRFRYANLVQPDEAIAQADLILCRNVLIYFGRDHALAAIQRLRSSLADDGLLLVGPTEAVGGLGLFEGFAESRFDGGLFYRKQAASIQPATADASPRRQEVFAEAIESNAGTPPPDDQRLRRALMQCEAALLQDRCDASLHLRHAALLEEASHPDKAREALRRALFLEPGLAEARAFLDRLTQQMEAEAVSPRHSSRPRLHRHGMTA